MLPKCIPASAKCHPYFSPLKCGAYVLRIYARGQRKFKLNFRWDNLFLFSPNVNQEYVHIKNISHIQRQFLIKNTYLQRSLFSSQSFIFEIDTLRKSRFYVFKVIFMHICIIVFLNLVFIMRVDTLWMIKRHDFKFTLFFYSYEV